MNQVKRLSLDNFKIIDPPILPIEEITAVRDVAMTYVRKNARSVTRRPDERAHRFVLYDDSGGAIGSGLTDTFLSVAVRKVESRRHRMRISFLELLLTEERRYSNMREVYCFDWHDDSDIVTARKKVTENLGKIVSTGLSEDGSLSDLVVPEVKERIYAIEPEDCDMLCDRMLEVTESVRQRAA